MPPSTSSSNLSTFTTKNKAYIAVGAIVFLILVIVILAFVFSGNEPTQSGGGPTIRKENYEDRGLQVEEHFAPTTVGFLFNKIAAPAPSPGNPGLRPGSHPSPSPGKPG